MRFPSRAANCGASDDRVDEFHPIAGWKAFAADPVFAPAYAASEAKHGKTFSEFETFKLLAPASGW